MWTHRSWCCLMWIWDVSVVIRSWIRVLFGPQDDLNLSGYRKYLTSQAAPLPLTAAEEELRQIKLNEVHTEFLFFILKGGGGFAMQMWYWISLWNENNKIPKTPWSPVSEIWKQTQFVSLKTSWTSFQRAQGQQPCVCEAAESLEQQDVGGDECVRLH